MSIFTSLTDETVKFAKQVAIISFTLVGLIALGFVVDQYLNFSFLTGFFVLIRRLIGLFDFAFDTDTLLMLLGYSLLISIGYWLFRAYMSITQFLNNK